MPATLSIDSAALAANYHKLQTIAARSDVGAAVKANAYGLGIERVAPILWQAGCRTFFVAHAQEGVTLRALLPEATIIVLHGVQADTAALIRAAKLIPALNNPQELRLWNAPAWLHVDTGMSRLGFNASDLPQNYTPLMLMSHLACADEPYHHMNVAQLKAFRAYRQSFTAIPCSLAASSGIFLGQAYHFEMVRSGIALYGGNPTPSAPNPMQPVITLSTPVLQLRDVPAGTPVGYAATFETNRPSRLATIEAGYADGILRAQSGRGTAIIHQQEVPMVGRISMDLIVLDVTDIAAPLAVGDEVALINPQLPIDTIAARAQTISYEVLTSLKLRASSLSI